MKVDKEECIGCGLCESICPEGFEMNDDGISQVKDESADCVDEAISSCPVDAITKE